MRILENTIDGCGRFGAMVGIGMGEGLKKGGAQDGQLFEYVVWVCPLHFLSWIALHFVLINAILQVVDEIELRVHLRSQLTTSGLTRIISVSSYNCYPFVYH